MNIKGRFAPSPTGPLHIGSLVSALGSYLEAKSRGGNWYIRIEDIDTVRCKPAWADEILKTLGVLGFEWDGEVIYQSRRLSLYEEAISYLKKNGWLYPCGCSRKEIADSSVQGIEGVVYPGTCRNGLLEGRLPRALRMITNNQSVLFRDIIQGEVRQCIESEIGDFVIRRADGLIAYQLAVVVDDWDQGINQVIRGADLLLSTPRQIYLQQRLSIETPIYGHLPVVLNDAGEKLSKQTGALAIDRSDPVRVIQWGLVFLGQAPPTGLTLKELWQWALEHWSLEKVPRQPAISA